MHSITDHLELNATPAAVYRAITTTAGERGWWTTDCELGERPGDSATFRFDPMGGKGGAMVVRFRLDRLEEAALVRMTCVEQENNPAWLDTELTFVLSGAGERTELGFAHTGFRDRGPVYEACVGGWKHFLGSLKAYVETGRGTPHERKG